MPAPAGQIPTSAFDSEVLPDALAPSSASPMPAFRANETFRTIGLSAPGGATTKFCTVSSRLGRGSTTGGAFGAAVTLQISRRRVRPWRAATSCFQVPSATSTGASARPIMIDDAIMTPPDALSATTR